MFQFRKVSEVSKVSKVLVAGKKLFNKEVYFKIGWNEF